MFPQVLLRLASLDLIHQRASVTQIEDQKAEAPDLEVSLLLAVSASRRSRALKGRWSYRHLRQFAP